MLLRFAWCLEFRLKHLFHGTVRGAGHVPTSQGLSDGRGIGIWVENPPSRVITGLEHEFFVTWDHPKRTSQVVLNKK